ncbi:MAG: hypothetical protein PHW02_01440 [bacterium]|nr:hypothetical protein [bacterium]
MVTAVISSVTKRCSLLLISNDKIYNEDSIGYDLVVNLPAAFFRAKVELHLNEIEIHRVIISGGPGYYTSLRIGESFAKGLLAGDSPTKLIKTDSLEVLASMVKSERKIITVLKARKDLYHSAVFMCDGKKRISRETENMLLTEKELSLWRHLDGVGEGLNYLEKGWERRIEGLDDPSAEAMYKYYMGV